MTFRIQHIPRSLHRLAPCAALALLPAAGQATLVNFDALPASTLPSGLPNNPASVLTTQLADQGVVFGLAGASTGVAVVDVGTLHFSGTNAIVGLDAAGLIPAFASGDIHFSFVVPGTLLPGVTNSVSFQVGDTCCDVDSVVIRAFDLAGQLLDEQALDGTSFQAYSLAMPGIHRIEVENTSPHTSGYALDDLLFSAPTGVPEPASVLLVGAALCALRMRGRRTLSDDERVARHIRADPAQGGNSQAEPG